MWGRWRRSQWRVHCLLTLTILRSTTHSRTLRRLISWLINWVSPVAAYLSGQSNEDAKSSDDFFGGCSNNSGRGEVQISRVGIEATRDVRLVRLGHFATAFGGLATPPGTYICVSESCHESPMALYQLQQPGCREYLPSMEHCLRKSSVVRIHDNASPAPPN